MNAQGRTSIMPICRSRASGNLSQRGCCGGNKLEFEIQLSSSTTVLYSPPNSDPRYVTGLTDSAKWQMSRYRTLATACSVVYKLASHSFAKRFFDAGTALSNKLLLVHEHFRLTLPATPVQYQAGLVLISNLSDSVHRIRTDQRFRC